MWFVACPLPLVLRKFFIRGELGPDLGCKVLILKGWVRIMSRGLFWGLEDGGGGLLEDLFAGYSGG